MFRSGHIKHRSKMPLSASLEKNLTNYDAAARAVTGINSQYNLRAAAAIGAVGLGVLTLPNLASARVVYTPVHKTFSGDSDPLVIDLNNDGVADLSLSASATT